jgi:SEC-C motif-containing protein
MPSCPCGSGKTYEDCCEPPIRGSTKAPTAEALMRSRYAAYEKCEIAHLTDSLHPKRRKGHDPDSSREWAEGSDWLRLEIVRTEDGGIGDTTGIVEFKAYYLPKNAETAEEVEHHEIAEFRREDDTWYFWEGKTIGPPPVTREEPKIGRNDPCPCGSGKKYKKCCGKA